ncbi:hypothetical protein BG000_002352 [Podila horticola]|nr:hypothetical protein BG000_002352 [Podila horticola]
MAQRLFSPPVISPVRFRAQLFTITLAVLLSNVLTALSHTPRSTYSTELVALDSAEAAFPQYNSVTESTWKPSEDYAYDDDDDLESPVSADELEPINEIAPRKHKTLNLAVLLPYNLTETNYVFRREAMLSATSSIKLAVEDINQAKILPVNISMQTYNSQPPEDNPLSGSNAMLQASSFVTKNASAVIGDAFSWLTEYSAMLTSALSIPQCSFSATSDSLNDPKLYSTFFRTVSSTEEQGQMMTAYVKKMGWRRVSVLYTDDPYGRSLARTIEDESARLGLRVLRSIPIYPKGGNERNISDVLATLEDAGSNINIIMAIDFPMLHALEEIQRKGMFGHPYVWIVINDIYDDIQRYFVGPSHPTADSFDGLVMFNPHVVRKSEEYNKFKQRWLQLDPAVYEGAGPGAEVTDWNIRGYSCAWVIALCYQKDIENARARGVSNAVILDELLYGSYPRTIGDFSAKLFSSVSYDGPAGLIKLNKFGNAIDQPSQFFQMQQNKLVLVATTGKTPDGYHRPVQIAGTHVWPGLPVSETPKDAPDWAFQNIRWNEGVARFMIAMMAIGVLESLVLIGVVLWQRQSPVIKTANVRFSILELLGIIILYSTVLLRFGVFSDVICFVSPLMFSLGLTLLIGSLAVKSLREYRLHNNILQHCHAIRDRRLLRQLVIIFAVFMIPAVVYIVVVRPRVKYVALGDDTDAWVCMRSQNHASNAAEAILVVIWFAPFPVLAAACAYMAGCTQDTLTTWNESRLIRYTMYNINSSDPSHTSDFSTQEEQHRYELAMRQYGFLSAGRQGAQPEPRRRKTTAVMGRQSSMERQICFSMEPTLKGPAAYTCTTGTLNGPDRNPSNLHNEASVRQRAGSQGLISLSSEGSTSVPGNFGPGTEDNDNDNNDAIPVLNETHWWFLRAMRQWRPMRVVVVVSLNLVILADDAKATLETCLYSSVTSVTEEGHYYMRIHCLKQKTLLLEFNSEEARDQWIQAFEVPMDEIRTNNLNDTGLTNCGASSDGTRSRARPQEMYQHQAEQNTRMIHERPFVALSPTLSDSE